MCRLLTVISYTKYGILKNSKYYGYEEWVTCVMGCKVKTYMRKYGKYTYYATAWTGSTKDYIDGKAGGKIYVEMYKHSNRLYVWYRNILAESTKASVGAVCKGATPSVEQPGGRGFKPRLRSLLD